MRVRLLLEILRRSLGRAIAVGNTDGSTRGLRGNASAKIWDVHCDNFRRRGWGYLKAREFVNVGSAS